MFVDVIAAVLIVCLCYVRKIILKVKKDYYEKRRYNKYNISCFSYRASFYNANQYKI